MLMDKVKDALRDVLLGKELKENAATKILWIHQFDDVRVQSELYQQRVLALPPRHLLTRRPLVLLILWRDRLAAL